MSAEQLLGSVEFGDTAVVADLEAGIGTLTRLAERRVDAVLVVVEPTPKSIEVGARAAHLAREKSLGNITVIANRVRDDADVAFVQQAFPGVPVAPVPEDAAILDAERRGAAPLDSAPDAPAVRALTDLAERLFDARATTGHVD